MATKEDILEQLVEEFLIHRGYFVRHNVKYLPRKDHVDFNSKHDSNHSDIDVLAFHPRRSGADRVWAVSCKSWQAGFDPAVKIDEIQRDKIVSGRRAWKGFRELVKPKWSEAFIGAVKNATGESCFTYVTAVTRLYGDKSLWENNPSFRNAMWNNPIRLLTLREMLDEVYREMNTTLAGTELGRTLQLFRAAGVQM
ncbi:MAG TPA: hypothetical protein VKT81_27825 [Bryobacteraceae bacterium]|nr:hypothetical protein [Bryobacteraceae bacterium]